MENSALKYLKLYQELDSYGDVGRLLFLFDEERSGEFKATKEEHENVFQWCVRRAIEELEG